MIERLTDYINKLQLQRGTKPQADSFITADRKRGLRVWAGMKRRSTGSSFKVEHIYTAAVCVRRRSEVSLHLLCVSAS